MDALNTFMAKSVPSYAALFESEHSESQALLLFENYLCYRALLDVLSLRVSRWEHLVKLLYHQVKDVLDEECTEWLRLVHLAVCTRDAIVSPNQNTYCDVLKCMKVNSALFASQEIYMNFSDDLNRSIASYFVLTEKDKNIALETCDTDERMMEVVSAFPCISPLQRSVLMYSKIPNSVLVAILDHLKHKVMEMQLPEMFSNCERDEQSEKEEVAVNQLSSEMMDTDEIGTSPTGVQSTETEEGYSEYQCESNNPSTTTTTTTTNNTITTTTTDDDSVAVDDKKKAKKYFLRERQMKTAVDDKKTPTPAKQYFLRKRKNDATSDEDEPTDRNGTLPGGQQVNNNKAVATSSDEDISEDDVGEEDKNFKPTAAPSGKARGVRHRWTPFEVKNLLEGVEMHGIGNWADICINYYFLPCRDPVSLKDKWRNMLKNKEVPKKYLRN